ncbi:MAG TPA: BACON domain-containing carbohydrate-binding protein, partial [Pyrinomonadaceae bacterium]|nr:BACON domain-containing carbohydrate-binding protein [Pyrinomonadaceae bacterium]
IISVGGQTFTVNQEAACSFAINPSSANFLAAGGNGSFNLTVLTGAGCAWTAISNQPWLITTSSGVGDGTINYSVAENTTLSSRTGTITVGGQVFTVNQEPVVCTYSINPTTAEIPAIGGAFSFTLSTNNSACPWTAVSNSPFIKTSSSGNGNGTINYTVAENTTTQRRSGTITVAGQTFTVNQEAACSFAINPTKANVKSAGGNGSFSLTVLTGSGCSWTAVSNSPFITTSSSGTGTGIVNYTVAENTAISSRSGTITVAGLTFTVNQDAPATCSGNPNPSNTLNVINYGQSYLSTLSNSSCEANTLFNDLYTFAGTEGDRIIITVDAAFFPGLELIGPRGNTIQFANGADRSRNIRLPESGPFFTLPETGNYTLRVSSNFFGGAGDYTLSIYNFPPSASCTYSFSTPRTFVPSGGGVFSVYVLTQPGCPPIATADIGVTDGNAIQILANIDGLIFFRVLPNTSSSERQVSIVMNGFTTITHTIVQYGNRPPSNDFFANAQQLPSVGLSNAPVKDSLRNASANSPAEGPVNGYNTGATAEANETAHA